MSDLVERLRSQADDWQGQGDDYYGPLFAEAADEIERLRAALKNIAGGYVSDDIADDDMAVTLQDMARAALGEAKDE